ncbi:MAG TPA: hypothetical protein PKX27_07195 [Bacteroidales bacterium]|nr:hypothetical protein [Bacteroidales bacterium]
MEQDLKEKVQEQAAVWGDAEKMTPMRILPHKEEEEVKAANPVQAEEKAEEEECNKVHKNK